MISLFGLPGKVKILERVDRWHCNKQRASRTLKVWKWEAMIN